MGEGPMDAKQRGKRVSESAINDQTAIVFPNDLNAYGTLYGGRVLELADQVAAVVAHRHAGRDCVTLAIDSVRFLAPAKRGDILVFQAAVNRAWRTSMEVGLRALVEDYKTLERKHIFSAYFTFVAMDEGFRPAEVCAVVPVTEDEKRRYEEAEGRRQRRLGR